MFYQAKEAVDFTKSPQLKETMESVCAPFPLTRGCLPVLDDKGNIKFRFDTNFMDPAADGRL